MKKDDTVNLSSQIAELRGITIKGFQGVDEHFKILNGKVAEHERRLNQNDLSQSEQKGKKEGMSNIWKIIYTGLTIILSILALFHWGKI